MQPEAIGTYDYAYRYTTTDGRDWFYADLAGPFSGHPGRLTVNESGDTTAKVISAYRVEDVGTGSGSQAGLICRAHVSRLCFVWAKNVSFDN